MFANFGYTEMLLFGVIAILLFGSRLPEVARNFGKTYGELKKNVDGFKRDFQEAQNYEPPPKLTEQYEEEEVVSKPSAPKFTPPPEDE